MAILLQMSHRILSSSFWLFPIFQIPISPIHLPHPQADFSFSSHSTWTFVGSGTTLGFLFNRSWLQLAQM
jgi:hypothetical protein